MEEIVVQDPQDVLKRIQEQPIQYEKAWTGLWTQTLPLKSELIKRVLILGMGGSGVAGQLVRELPLTGNISIDTWADYQLPNWVEASTLVVAVSYSGETEETLDALNFALKKKAQVVAVTTGGKLAQIGKKKGFAVLRFTYPSAPREAIGFLYGLVITLLAKLSVVKVQEKDYFDALGELQQAVKDKDFREKAEKLSVLLANKIPVIISSAPLTGVTKRWANQFNENSNTFAAAFSLPEISHNFVAGLDYPNPEKLAVFLLKSGYAFSRNTTRDKLLEEVLVKKEIQTTPLELTSRSILAEQWLFIYFGDLLSYYLAGVNGVDPSAIEPIQFLKSELKKAQ